MWEIIKVIAAAYEWLPPVEMTNALLIGDKTVLLAIKSILEQLAQQLNPVQARRGRLLKCADGGRLL
ncbi:MAG: hypothetical protein ACR5LD_09320 [Symbiopectobacterium sp.]